MSGLLGALEGYEAPKFRQPYLGMKRGLMAKFLDGSNYLETPNLPSKLLEEGF